MATTSLFVLFVVSVSGVCWADINIADYVYWKKADISAWHLYFPNRTMEMERQTNRMAVKAVQKVSEDLIPSLSKIVQYQAQELLTAQLMMEGTSAQGCIRGISNYIDNALSEASSNFQDCSADALPKLERSYSNWTKANNGLQTVYYRALTGIDSCARTYPNKDSASRLKSCVEYWFNYYFTNANGTRTNVSSSPSMKVFSDLTVLCAETAGQRVVAKGWTFLGMLVQCAKLSENIDAQNYEMEIYQEFSQFVTGINFNEQILNAQSETSAKVNQIEEEMLFYYNLQKTALEKYIVEPRGYAYYYALMQGYLQKYNDTIISTGNDNPAKEQCTDDAEYTLYGVIDKESQESVKCDENIVSQTKTLIETVNNYFLSINSALTSIGNVIILSCFEQGYIYAEKTISKCSHLKSSGFNVNFTEINDEIVKNVNVLLDLEKNFFSNSSFPCGDLTLTKAYLEAETVLYNLERCMYINPANKYDVTTSLP